ncbi:MAG: DUF502 domain-containing protein [Pseudomonadota bacterium]
MVENDEDDPLNMQAPRRRSSFWSRMRANFLTGLVVVAPIVLTIYLTWAIITFIDDQIVPLVPSIYNPSTYIDVDIPGFGVIVFLVFTTFIGTLARRVFGRQMIRWGEGLIDRTPIIRSIYNAIKQIAETVFSQSKSSFKQACIVEYPRRGIWAVAFVSTDTTGEVPQKAGRDDMISVFLPTTPNPTSGFLLFVPREDVHLLDMTVEDAAKLVISAGLVVPPTKAEREEAKKLAEERRRELAEKATAKNGRR